MPSLTSNGISLTYQIEGRENGNPLLLVMGLGGQLTLWPDPLCAALARQGFRVIRFDNRDVGLSQKMSEFGTPDLGTALRSLMAGHRPTPPYSLTDMARDAIGLLDGLGIRRAHIVGMSMGGMISQILAARWPERVTSLVSIMSTSGDPSLPPARPEATAVMLSKPVSADRQDIVDFSIKLWRTIGSPGFMPDTVYLSRLAERQIDRDYDPVGIARQYMAILGAEPRTDLLRTIRTPTLVIHGSDDPLVPVEAGRHVASLIPNASWLEIPGMGHDLAPGLWPILVRAITGHCRPQG